MLFSRAIEHFNGFLACPIGKLFFVLIYEVGGTEQHCYSIPLGILYDMYFIGM